ncbi:MAG TPA: PKD domain-containing protein [Thermoplasmata archaeon]|nr:PKD domain-containing protein [Thermoplasmata archaeon]
MSGVLGNWTNITSSAGHIEPRRGHDAIAYDPELGVVVLFGGYDPENNSMLNDTWEFSNGVWTDVTSTLASSPPPMFGTAMVWDAADGYLVLFGGRDTLGDFFNGTWTFDGSAWNPISTSAAPSGRASATMSYDAADGYVLLEGGFNSAVPVLQDSWTYAGGVWTNITSQVVGQLPRANFGVSAYDAHDGYVVFFGYSLSGCHGAGATWIYSHGHYWNITADQTEFPQSSSGSSMMDYDPILGMVLLFSGYASGGGSTCLTTQETFGFSEGIWHNLSGVIPKVAPGRCCVPMVFDPADGYDLITEGSPNNTRPPGLPDKDDTWTFTVAHPFSVAMGAFPRAGVAPYAADLSVNFTGGLAPFTVQWDFGDSTPNGTGMAVSHTFHAAGLYTVHVAVTDAVGESQNDTVVLQVAAPLVATGITQGPPYGLAPLSLTFTGSFQGGLSPFRLLWDFGDHSATSTFPMVTHSYAAVGNYTASFKVNDSLGETAWSNVSVSVVAPLTVKAVANTTQGAAPLSVSFLEDVSGGHAPFQYYWNFGDASPNASTAGATHVYQSGGTYTATLVVLDGIGERVTRNLTITVNGPGGPSTGNNPSGGGWTSTDTLLAVVGLVAAVAVVAGIWVWRGRRNAPPPPGEVAP